MRAAGIDTAAVLRSSLIAFLEGALLYGVFHGDLHGGNLWSRRTARWPCWTSGSPGGSTSGSAWPSCACRWGPPPTTSTVQVEALRDLGALPADSDVEAVIRDLGLDRPAVDPTTLTADEMVAELRDVTKALLGYGARMPKELMLFVKDILFLNGAMATMAPDVDILGEILAVVTYFTERHGEQIAREVGVGAARTPRSTSTATGRPWASPTRPTRSPSRTCRSAASSSAAASRTVASSEAAGRSSGPCTTSSAPSGPEPARAGRPRVRTGRLATGPGSRPEPPATTVRGMPLGRRRGRWRSEDTKAAAPSGPAPSSSRRTSAEPTTTPSATSHTAAACSGVETPMPTQTGRWVAPTTRSATSRAESASTACSPVTPMRPTA